ncbi:peptidoglycan-binding LysM domain-protein [Phialemonium atrogriseum]|uniref:Peptidoglycan-binding LysM domain-protein n=1 Tax=Phialemonium atrogriseum TaxID=1093897 RepID=A0AAJ0BY22_9PEZI|nr:peptidoglycan-binding LysM domain-protein [Phialemonium atrogriseum]KAK1765214.1 peptidoglycan-binding LysM domain-protein [Phialemonium atrogriseum]
MSRFSQYDTDEERLPEGMRRVGYDADTQVHTFQDADGSYWEGAPGSQYGRLTRVGDDDNPSSDNQPFLASDQLQPKVSWRHEMMPLLNFALLIGLTLVVLFWFLYRGAGSGGKKAEVRCEPGSEVYTIKSGDTCWAIAEDRGISVEDILGWNPKLVCDALAVGSMICLPE